MKTYIFLAAANIAVVNARFGQEQGDGAIAAIGALTDLGQPGQAATLAGQSIQFLLAAANPCGKLTQADLILSQLGTSDGAVAAARGLVAAEQNFNPFVVTIPSICSDATLPKSPELRGVVPLIDPAVVGSETENNNAKTSKANPFQADGLSVAQVMIAQGFSNFTSVAADGTKQRNTNKPATGSSSDQGNKAPTKDVPTTANPPKVIGCANVRPTTLVTVASPSAQTSATNTANAGGCTGSGNTMTCSAPQQGTGAVQNDVTGNFDGFQASSIQGLDFGLCVPTMKFEAGLNGRSNTEFTFQAVDPLVNKGQQEALNPNIITNRIHDQLTNVCGANAEAKAAVAAAQAKISALGTRDANTANTWNTLLGFENANINPDNAPKAGLVGHT